MKMSKNTYKEIKTYIKLQNYLLLQNVAKIDRAFIEIKCVHARAKFARIITYDDELLSIYIFMHKINKEKIRKV